MNAQEAEKIVDEIIKQSNTSKEELQMNVNKINNETIGAVRKRPSHVSFKECFSHGWRLQFRKEGTLLQIIEAAGLAITHEFVQVNSEYLIDENRIAKIILLKRKETEILDKVIVDAICSWPTFGQLMDVLYNVGSDCDYHVVVYDENTKREDLQDDCVVGSMLTSLLDYLSGTVSLTAMGIDFEVNESTALTFRCLNKESIGKDNNENKLPDRQALEQAEFWTNYFLPAHRAYGMDLHEYCFEMCGYEEDGSDYISSSADWDDDGMSVTYTFNEDDFTWLFRKKVTDMEEIFEDCSISHGTEQNRRTLKHDISVRDIVNVIPDEEKHHGPVSHSVTICRPIPFRNFIYSLHERSGEFDR